MPYFVIKGTEVHNIENLKGERYCELISKKVIHMGDFYLLVILALWLVSIILIWEDATKRRGFRYGCLWLTLVFLAGPIGLIIYFLIKER